MLYNQYLFKQGYLSEQAKGKFKSKKQFTETTKSEYEESYPLTARETKSVLITNRPTSTQRQTVNKTPVKQSASKILFTTSTQATFRTTKKNRQSVDTQQTETNDDKKISQFLSPKEKKVFNQAEEVIFYYKQDCQKLIENIYKDYINPEQVTLNFLESNLQAILKIINFAKAAIQARQNRATLEEYFQQITTELQSVKNQCFLMYTYYTLARVMENYRNPIYTILLYKQTKRMSDCEAFYKTKMKAYRGLGQQFLNIRPNLAQLYLTKFLMASWKTDKPSCELEAYDLLGKYYFYVGDLKKAGLFHHKMAKGHHEGEKSALKRLAVAKLNSGSLGVKRKEQKYTELVEEPEFQVSSDEEVFDVLFQRDKYKEQQEQNREREKQFEKKTILKFPLRQLPKFDRSEDDHRRRQEFRDANTHIRLKQKQVESDLINDDGQIDVSKLKISKSRSKFGEFKDKILVQHLSPNRTLGAFQNIELTRDSKAYKRSPNLNPYFERKELTQVARKLQKFTLFLSVIVQQLEMMQTLFKARPKMEKPAADRRKALLID